MNRINFIDSADAIQIKLFSSVAALSTAAFKLGIKMDFQKFLLAHNLLIEYFYWGLVGQIIATLLQFQAKLDGNEEQSTKPSWRALGSLFIRWLTAPIIALIIVSLVSQTYTLFFGVFAFGVGAFSEYGWDYIKKFTTKQLDNTIINKP